jgi:hypothetical protein
MGGKRIVQDLASQIREQANGPALQDYICKKNEWTDDQFTMICWPTINQVMKNLPSHRRIQATKLQHNKLPTAYHLSYGDRTQQACPRCNYTKETTDHVLQCPEGITERNDAWNDFLTTAKRIETSPYLLLQLEQAIRNWQEGNDHPELYEDDYSDDDIHARQVNEAFILQSSIGWKQALRGRLVTHWRDAQHSYLRTLPQKPKYDCQQWLSNIVRALIEYSITLWKARSHFVHNEHKQRLAITSRHDRERRITEAYASPDHVRVGDRHLFALPVEIRLTHNRTSQEKWLYSYEIAVEARHREHEIQASRQQTLTDLWSASGGRRPRVRLR